MSYYDTPVGVVVKAYREFYVFCFWLIRQHVSKNPGKSQPDFKTMQQFGMSLLKTSSGSIRLLLEGTVDILPKEKACFDKELKKLKRALKKRGILQNKRRKLSHIQVQIRSAWKVLRLPVFDKEIFTLVRDIHVIGHISTSYDHIARTLDYAPPFTDESLAFFSGHLSGLSKSEQNEVPWNKDRNKSLNGNSPISVMKTFKYSRLKEPVDQRQMKSAPNSDKCKSDNGTTTSLSLTDSDSIRLRIVLKRLAESLLPSIRIDPNTIDFDLVHFILSKNLGEEVSADNLIDWSFVKELAIKRGISVDL
ncbi:MAG TPA: hypothetical protein PKA63_12890 [Oligoflexia bacterium]|nr:hypothetical protein [Oligoflexia bacterium]HMP49555.1 hypothetical protein [Oligoflexia bacterium]